MKHQYTSEKNFQILIYLMKAHGIRKVICDPGTTNISLVASIQDDPFFQLYSSVDERSAAYMACGMAAESGEPVAITCTGATASRDYMPGLTEAYYRQLPVLAITAMRHPGTIGQYVPQVIDRTNVPNDVCRTSVTIPFPSCTEDEAMCNRRINEALLELRHHGGGPVHINIETRNPTDYSIKSLPAQRVIRRYSVSDQLPELPKGRIGVFIGSHLPMSDDESKALDDFCARYGAIAVCDQTSNYRGRYRVLAPLVAKQDLSHPSFLHFDVLIHIGEVSGAYMNVSASEVWRINPDGQIRDTFGTLTKVFEMRERDFFSAYASMNSWNSSFETSSLQQWNNAYSNAVSKIPELPYSNLWIAQQTASRLPGGSVLQLGILNSLRSWNFFETPESVTVFSNTGGFGIDGALSTALGAALAAPQKIVILVLGDLAFFYDMNALGNRSLPANLRVLLINNGMGAEFRMYSHVAAMFGSDANPYIAAAGHFGSKSPDLVRHYATDLGCEYFAAADKNSFAEALPALVDTNQREKALIVEAFTNEVDESNALQMVSRVEVDTKCAVKSFVKGILGNEGTKTVKNIIGRK
ncbi:thiamine pyrophosphate-binding protein [Bifidobacterium thermophilum]|uniref:Thiamine pyrophosphate-binding protein n=1 Tax=Bifidobacterium thermophilum TaxID=33905 RepID=A0A2N3QPD3_9BIFI|nr:thiamine pyrophosphate-binding protein [Bifidobacterium thermophilum]PKU93555.1 thiamine pyrophosphate-binding protein [Bifidobacterium thermophilum]